MPFICVRFFKGRTGSPAPSSPCTVSFDPRVLDVDTKANIVGLQAGSTVQVRNNQILRTSVTRL